MLQTLPEWDPKPLATCTLQGVLMGDPVKLWCRESVCVCICAWVRYFFTPANAFREWRPLLSNDESPRVADDTANMYVKKIPIANQWIHSRLPASKADIIQASVPVYTLICWLCPDWLTATMVQSGGRHDEWSDWRWIQGNNSGCSSLLQLQLSQCSYARHLHSKLTRGCVQGAVDGADLSNMHTTKNV